MASFSPPSSKGEGPLFCPHLAPHLDLNVKSAYDEFPAGRESRAANAHVENIKQVHKVELTKLQGKLEEV